MSATDQPTPEMPPLNTAAVNTLTEDDLAMFKELTGIKDETALKDHLVKIALEAYKIIPYPCISQFHFARNEKQQSAHQKALSVCLQRETGIYLDIGACFGVDTRLAVRDGLPIKKVVASDLIPKFWELGHELFKSTPESFPVAFVAGDAFDTIFISGREPCTEVPTTGPPSDLQSLKTLTPLQGHVSVIHAAALFHLFDRGRQVELARALSSLLSPLAGSMIYGRNAGAPQAWEYKHSSGYRMFIHSPETWKELWDGTIFPSGSVEVQTELVKRGDGNYSMSWSVTKL